MKESGKKYLKQEFSKEHYYLYTLSEYVRFAFIYAESTLYEVAKTTVEHTQPAKGLQKAKIGRRQQRQFDELQLSVCFMWPSIFLPNVGVTKVCF